jgi:O-antigen ligase
MDGCQQPWRKPIHQEPSLDVRACKVQRETDAQLAGEAYELMKFEKTLSLLGSKVVIITVMIVACVLIGRTLPGAIDAGAQKTVVALVMLPFLLSAPYFLSAFGAHVFVRAALFLFWLPVPFILSGLYLTEATMWAFMAFVAASAVVSKDPRFLSRLNRFPIKPFLLYIVGAVIVYSTSSSIGTELGIIRTICVFPLALSLTVFWTVESAEDAERYLWIVLISASLLALLFLFGQRLFSFVAESAYSSGTGRVSMQLVIPYLGPLTINPASAGDKFAFMFSLAYAFCVSHRSSFVRATAVVMCLIFGAAIASAQGRAGGLAIIASTILTTLLFARIGSIGVRSLLSLGIVLGFVLGAFWYLALDASSSTYYDRIMVLLVDPTSDPNYIGRVEMWQEGLRVFMQNPLGIGLYNFTIGSNGDTWNVHNLLLYLLLSFGTLGFAGFAWIILTFARAFWRGIESANPSIQRLSVVGIALIVDLVVTGQFSPVVWEPYSVVIVWAPLATVYAIATLEHRQSVDVSRSNRIKLQSHASTAAVSD